MGFPGGSDGKEFSCNGENLGLIPGLGRSPGESHGNPLWYSCLEDPHGQEEPGGLQSMGSQRVRHDWVTKHTAKGCTVDSDEEKPEGKPKGIDQHLDALGPSKRDNRKTQKSAQRGLQSDCTHNCICRWKHQMYKSLGWCGGQNTTTITEGRTRSCS